MRGWRARLLGSLPPAVTGPAFRVAQRVQALSEPEGESDDGLPLPPRHLRVLTAGTAKADHFLVLGRRAAEEFVSLAQAHGQPLGAGAVLEFGVGCGRVARHVTRRRPGVAFHGCDIDPRLLAWSRDHLPGAYEVTAGDPPLPYADAVFDLVYALSVFTHLHDANARAWLEELARVTRPGGLAILTHHDERLPQATVIRQALDRDGYAVFSEGVEGSNLLSTYFTAAALAERAAPRWSLVQSLGSDASATGQGVAVLRRATT